MFAWILHEEEFADHFHWIIGLILTLSKIKLIEKWEYLMLFLTLLVRRWTQREAFKRKIERAINHFCVVCMHLLDTQQPAACDFAISWQHWDLVEGFSVWLVAVFSAVY